MTTTQFKNWLERMTFSEFDNFAQLFWAVHIKQRPEWYPEGFDWQQPDAKALPIHCPRTRWQLISNEIGRRGC